MMLLALGSPARADVSPLPRTNPSSGAGSADEDWRRARILVDAGAGVPVLPDDFKRYWNPGFGFGLGYLRPIAPYLDAVLRWESFEMPFDEGALRADRGLAPSTSVSGGGRALVSAILIGIRIHRSTEGLRPYLELGAGLPDLSVPAASYNDPVVGSGTVGSTEIFGFDPCFMAGAGLEWYRARTWGAFLDARLIDAPGHTEPAHAWVSIRSGVSVRLWRPRH